MGNSRSALESIALCPIVPEVMSTLVQIPEGIREGDSRLIHLTDPAVRKVESLRMREGQGEYLRVAISGGGCNGLSYRMKFVDQTRKGDIAVRFGDVLVLVGDNKHLRKFTDI